MIGRSAKEFVHPDDLEGTRENMRLARRGRLKRNFECRYMHKDGRPVPISWTGIWSEPDGQYFFIGRDMTERITLREPAAPGAEDGGDRPAHRRRRARLQQHPHRHHRHDRASVRRGRVEPATAADRRGGRRSRNARRAAHAAHAGLRAQAAAAGADDRPQRGRLAQRRDAAAHARRGHRGEADATRRTCGRRSPIPRRSRTRSSISPSMRATRCRTAGGS